jgi:uncharacterized protein (TIGR02646 family)
MKKITKTAAPTSFQQYIRASNASYKDMDTAVKEELLEALIQEQGGVCAYCQIKLKTETATIEHHCEHSICNGLEGTEDRRLDYSNLFAVCPGIAPSQSKKKQFHCDTQKATFNSTNGLPMTVCPSNTAHISTIKYSSTGNITSSNEDYNGEMDNILNLNIPHIKQMRKDKWLRFFKYSRRKDGTTNTEKMKKLLELDLTKIGNHYKNNFPGLSIYIKDKFC